MSWITRSATGPAEGCRIPSVSLRTFAPCGDPSAGCEPPTAGGPAPWWRSGAASH